MAIHTYPGYEGVTYLREAAKWSEWVKEDYWEGWTAEMIVVLFLGWQDHELDEFPDQASNASICAAMRRGRARLKAERAAEERRVARDRRGYR